MNTLIKISISQDGASQSTSHMLGFKGPFNLAFQRFLAAKSFITFSAIPKLAQKYKVNLPS